MYMSAHTLQGPVPTVDLRTPEEYETTQHNVYTLTILHIPLTINSVYIHETELFSTVSFVYTQIQCYSVVCRERRRRFFLSRTSI